MPSHAQIDVLGNFELVGYPKEIARHNSSDHTSEPRPDIEKGVEPKPDTKEGKFGIHEPSQTPGKLYM